MDERTRTQLAYLIQGLMGASTREDVDAFLQSVQEHNGKFPPKLQKAINAVLASLPSGQLSREDFKTVAKKLLREADPSKQQAGRAVAWALELRVA